MTAHGLTDQEWKPNLFIAGFNKCGTTELCDYLSQHPDIFLPFGKEPNTFWDLPKYPPYFSGDRTGNRKYRRFSNMDEYYEMFSKGKKCRYRIDGTVSYTFDPKFSRILKLFSKNAKVILLIRDQTHRLASMYFFSLIRHKENDFGKWLNDYFIPYIETYLYYDKVAAYYHEFGHDNNLRIIETKNLSSEDVHNQIFEYLGLKPVKINVRHKNPNLVGPADSKAYRQLILTLTSIKLRTLAAAHRVGLWNEANRAAFVIGMLGRTLLRRNREKSSSYSNIIKLIPDTISSILDQDYRKTIDFAVEKRIMIRPRC